MTDGLYPTKLLALVGFLCFSFAASAQSFKVIVLDALSGAPQAGAQVSYFCAGSPHNSKSNSVITDGLGIAEVPYLCAETQVISLSVFPSKKKEQCGGSGPGSIQEIMTTGFISAPDSAGNIWCPTKISRKMTPFPGQVVIFVKKPTWYQSHIAG